MVRVETQIDELSFQGADGERYLLQFGYKMTGEVTTIKVQKQRLEKTSLGEYWAGAEEPMKITIPDIPYSERYKTS